METDKIVYFVRHGQSVDNVSPVFQSPDSPLSEVGKRQAEQIATRISHLSFEALIASPFQRAKETAEAIEKTTNKKAEFSPLFVERLKPASINGKSRADERVMKIGDEWEQSLCTSGMRVEDGENFDDILIRANRALDFLKNRTEKSIVVVTHGYFLRTIVASVLLGHTLSGESFKHFHQSATHENTGLTVLRHHVGSGAPSKWSLWIYNDHAHLAD